MKRSTRARRLLVLSLASVLGAGAVACSSEEEPPAIRVREADVIVQNRTSAAWTDVEVWVNDHFRGVAPALQPSQQLAVPLNSLQAAFGQRFDRSRQAVFGVLVKARAVDGKEVRLTWGRVQRQ